MVNRKLSDTATEADWSFFALDGFDQALRVESEVIAAKYHTDAEDLYHEALISLAVRPDVTASAAAEGRDVVKLLVFRASRFMVRRAQTAAKHDHDDYPLDDLWFDGNEG